MFIAITSCEKKPANFTYPGFITAGQEEGDGVLYRDIPDDTISIPGFPDTLAVAFPLDLDMNNTDDFEIVYTVSTPYMLGAGGSSLSITPLGNNAVCISDTGVPWAADLQFNDTINSLNIWSDSTALLYSRYWILGGEISVRGFWTTGSGIFIGVKLVRGKHEEFGWIEIQKNVIRRYAITLPYKPV